MLLPMASEHPRAEQITNWLKLACYSCAVSQQSSRFLPDSCLRHMWSKLCQATLQPLQQSSRFLLQ